MSVNRFEITALLICATPDVRVAETVSGRRVTVIIDIRENRATETAAAARSVIDRRRAATAAGPTLLRIGRPDDDFGQDAIGRLVALRPDGFVLSGCGGLADVQRLDVMLRVAEAEQGIESGSTVVLAEVGQRPEFFLSGQSLKGVSDRLKAIVFDGAGLMHATASQAVNTPAARAGAPLLLARAAAIIKARQADLPCYDLLPENLPQDDDPQTVRDIALADGFSGVIARNAAQLAALASG
ncbi:aldolase [Rhizobium herbae]|uniref:Citrate lyase beta subunit n=1 Tax=Rhizobium herbae TaxID=508661 RepID=A0ABS4EFA0_9HYPH|nr:aldolase [Rhizobium herbae]MBP1856599.1 citrate lyase beta subunit [Rhizobium herbae]